MFDHCNMEAMFMRWLKRDRQKIGIALAGTLLLLSLVVWLPVSAVDAHEEASGFVGPGAVTVQATPTEDATVTLLNKEKLAQEVKQLKNQNEPTFFDWLRGNASILLSTLLVVGGGVFGLVRYLAERRDAQKRLLEDRQAEREKRAEERFQAVVEGLGSEREEAKVGAAITLRTFLRPGYEQFYTQVFDLAIAHLRLSRTSHPSEDPDGISHSPEDPNTPLPLTTLRQALIAVFKEAFPLARDSNSSSEEGAVQSLDAPGVRLDPAGYPVYPAYVPMQSLDASGVRLDNAYLVGADLERVYMREGGLRKVNLRDAKLGEAYLQWADLSGAYLRRVDLRGAKLMGTDLRGSSPWDADLRGADCHEADFSGATLDLTDLRGAGLWQAKLRRADLRGARLSGADLHEADLSEADLRETDLEDALSLIDTNLRGVKGLTNKQLEACKAKGAIIDRDPTASSSQSTISTPSPPQGNDTPAQSATSAQGSALTPDTGGSGAASSKPGPES